MRIATRGRFEWNGTRYIFIEEAGFDYSGPLAETKGDKQTQTDANTKQALADSKAKSDAALKSQNSSVNDYKAAIAKVASRDLYINPQRQGMVRQAVATNTDAAQKNTEGQLSEYGLRTGVNTANIPATIAEGQRESQRIGHDTLVKDQLDQESKYEDAQKFAAGALGAIPGIYGQNNSAALSYGASAMGSQASVDAQRVVPQTPWWQSVLQAGAQVASAAIPVACPAEGSLYLMADGTEKPVEELAVGDMLLGIDGEPETIDEIMSAVVEIIAITTDNGFVTRTSASHAFALPHGGFAVAVKSLGKEIVTKEGPSIVADVRSAGRARVFNVITDGSHTYRADGVWSLGVGEAERHVSMDVWEKIGSSLMAKMAS